VPNGQAQVQAARAAKAAEVNRYTIVDGDTIESVAARFKVMPETVMGSNGIFDSEEALAPGRLLIVPPVDGMYYVVAKGDTLFNVAHKFQVNPDVITSYTANKVGSNGELAEGTALVIPGGMVPERETIIAYTVKKGDILKSIASRFGIDVPTMINSNDIPDPDNLQPGMQLRVLPVQGLEYKVKKGDTIISIADRYGTSPQMILDYAPNHLAADSTLQIDQVIMLPGGSPPQIVAAVRVAPREQPSSRGVERPPQPESKPQPQPKPQPKPPVKQPPAVDNSPKVGTGRMVWPVNGTITQYFSRRHNGLDIAIRAGTPIHAADSGKVVWSGWRTDGLGYCVIVDHMNGLTTVYGHMIRQPSVYVGQYVKRGQVIGNVGSTGRSTGPHVHFMVKHGSSASHDYRNPLAYLGR
jgi:murein DD-endopeptidase MepM/ murein hydrolase activator NlpD